MSDVAILIGTHDRYHAAWPAMCHGLGKYLKISWPIYWSNNRVDPPCGKGLYIGGDREWGRNVRISLRELQKRYFAVVLWMPEDTWLIESANMAAITVYVSYIRLGLADHIRLVPSKATVSAGDFEHDDGLFIIHLDSPYRTSMCAGLWNIKTFLELIIDADTIWSFEKEGTLRSKGRQFLCAKKNPMPYVLPEEGSGYAWSPIKRGKWTPGARHWAKKEGVEIDFSKHPKDY